MKTKINLLAAGMFLAALVNGLGQTATDTLPNAAQESVPGMPGVATKRAVVNFAELALRESPVPPASQPNGPVANGPTIAGVDACPVTNAPAPISSFLAYEDNGRESPPDSQGAVGPNHLMVTLNQVVRIQDRSGAVISTVTPSNFWASLGPFPDIALPSIQIFDPRILFDPFEHRWIFADLVNGPLNINLVGVSKTSDPTGDWNLYRFDLPFNDPLSDHPSMGFNKHWIVYQQNMFNAAGNYFVRSDVIIYNKANLYAGGPGLYTYVTNAAPDETQVPATTLDPDLPIMYLLGEVGTGGTSLNSVRLYTITGAVGSEVFTRGPTITVTNRWNSSGFVAVLPQLGTNQNIEIDNGRIKGLVFRNGSLWATHHLRLSGISSRTSIQWWQISPHGEILQRGLIDDPSGRISYAFPSLSVNKFNEVLIGYNRFSTNQYASGNYAFRAASDPPNTMRSDVVLKSGEAPYVKIFSDRNRWGDYSATVVDPVNDLDLWTIQEYAAAPVSGQARWGTWWGHIVPPLNLAIQQSATPNPVLESQTLTYTIAVNYTGPTDVTGVILTNILPAGVTLLSAATSQGSCTSSGNLVQCGLGTLTNGGSVTLTLMVTNLTPGNLTNTAIVCASECPTLITNSMVTGVNADTDRDGMPDSWELANGLNPNDPSDAPLDPDGDGVINLKEYLASTNPTNAASVLRITGVTRITTGTSPGERISFRTVLNRFYRLERTENPGSGAWVVVADEIRGTGGVLAVTDPKAGGEVQRFYRVQVLP